MYFYYLAGQIALTGGQNFWLGGKLNPVYIVMANIFFNHLISFRNFDTVKILNL